MRKYAVSTWSPEGIDEDTSKCVQGVYPGVGITSLQCSRKRGHGRDGDYCWQHARQNPASG